MFCHSHPYPPYIPDQCTKLIVGTLPPPRFTTGELRQGDVNFCYGSRDGQLWPILDRLFDLNLVYENSARAIEQRKSFLRQRGIGICDIVERAYRQKVDATDAGMQEVVLRNLIEILASHPSVDTLLFTGGNSKNGPEYFFRRMLRARNIGLRILNPEVPRIHAFDLPDSNRTIQTVSLTAPSGSANRAVGSMKAYKEMKSKDSSFTTLDFRCMQYRPYF